MKITVSRIKSKRDYEDVFGFLMYKFRPKTFLIKQCFKMETVLLLVEILFFRSPIVLRLDLYSVLEFEK